VAGRACPSCSSSSPVPALDLGAYRVLRCSACSLLYTDPLPSVGQVDELYSEEFYEAPLPPMMAAVRNWLHDLVMSERGRSLRGIAAGRLLDVGCGDGDFLLLMRRRGWDVRGCDTSPAAIGRARGRGVDVQQGSVATAAFPDAFFDAVTLWHVLEHLADPVSELNEVARILKPDGVLAIEVPNAGSPTFRLCGSRWFPLDVPRHLMHFTRTSITELLRRCGFEIVSLTAAHLADPAVVSLSLLGKSGLAESGADRYRAFSSSGLRKTFHTVAAAVAAAGLSIPYSLVASLVLRAGESMTITARRA
jgi:SAM-dependent methyltransferase